MYSQIAANKRKTVFIMFFFFVLAALIGWLAGQYFGDLTFTIIILGVAAIYALWSYFNASKLALAVNGAVEIEKKDNPRLYRTVENLTIAEGLPMPKVYVIEDRAANAFASGRDPEHSVVAATTGLLDILDDNELEGVMAHELGHIKNYDIRVAMIAFALVTAVALISDILMRSFWFGGGRRDNREGGNIFAVLALVGAVLAPIVATLLHLAVSRRREFLADATGALTTRYPEGLARALAKISQRGSQLKRQNTATAHFFILNPLSGRSLAGLFSTHPPVEERIKRLQEMETSP